MIGKVLRGRRVGGLLRYLFGPGQANEHNDPDLAAGWLPLSSLEPSVGADGRRDFTALTGLDPRASGLAEINRVAEVHFHLRHQLEAALEAYHFTEEGRRARNTQAVNYKQYWQQTYEDRYFDMDTLQRLATATETGLRHHHRAVAGPTLARAATKDRGVFQALVHPERLLQRYQDGCGYDLSTNSSWQDMQLLMAHRHLYAHRSGLVDDHYLDDVRSVSGEDLRPTMQLLGYPEEEVAWFAPLHQLNLYIEDGRRFFRHLPAGRSVPTD